jgi:UDP-2,4-diacetamido-2,4,6-trideoxy-beta-L-altropyranose hydrolase
VFAVEPTRQRRVRFRFDASREMGLGHAYRCLALATALKKENWVVDFAVSEITLSVFQVKIGEIIALPDGLTVREEATQIGEAGGKVDLLVVDHYGRNYIFEGCCRAWTTKILVIDDLADRKHDCDLLLDQTLGRSKAAYMPLVPASCTILVGSDYALLRDQFAKQRFFSREKERSFPPQNIMINVGGTDPQNITKTIIYGLQLSGYACHLHVVGGEVGPNLDNLGLQISKYKNVENMASLYAMADLAIGAAGTSSWERCCLGLPTLLLVTAANQLPNTRSLIAARAVSYLGDADGLTPESISNSVSKLFENPSALVTLERNARLICDGLGVGRVICRVAQLFDEGALALVLRRAERSDCDLVYAWQVEKDARRYMRVTRVPTYSEHVSWFEAKLQDTRSILNIIESSCSPCGVLRADADLEKHQFEISILLTKSAHGRRIASNALRLLSKQLLWADLFAEIHCENQASINAFLRAGFNPSGSGYLLSRRLVGEAPSADSTD